jgi:hypothetical protein
MGTQVKLVNLAADIADAIVAVDRSEIPHKPYAPGVGPYPERKLVKEIATRLAGKKAYAAGFRKQGRVDLIVSGQWALEFKIARPYGNNGKLAENWSVNLLHPYAGNESSVGDALKLAKLEVPERRAVVVVGYEHAPPQVDLGPLVRAFELISANISGVRLGPRVELKRKGLIHRHHQVLRLFAWEVLGLRT